MREGNLTLPEWRLFLLSECIKVYGYVFEYTALLRSGGKEAVLSIGQMEADDLNHFVTDEDCVGIRERLRSEWKFSGKVVDNGYKNYSTCDYCQKQEIRYRYLVLNTLNQTWLSLGSVCVGRIIHGEDKMQDRNFSKKFVSGLEAMRVKGTKDNSNKSFHQLRLEQHDRIKHATLYMREHGYDDLPFYRSLEKQWCERKLLSPNQEASLLEMYASCKKKGEQAKV